MSTQGGTILRQLAGREEVGVPRAPLPPVDYGYFELAAARHGGRARVLPPWQGHAAKTAHRACGGRRRSERNSRHRGRLAVLGWEGKSVLVGCSSASLRSTPLHSAPLRSAPLLSAPLPFLPFLRFVRSTPLHSAPLRSSSAPAPLHSAPLRSTAWTPECGSAVEKQCRKGQLTSTLFSSQPSTAK